MSDEAKNPWQFPLLNGSNYAEWAMRMEAVLVLSGRWDVVSFQVDDKAKAPTEVAAEFEAWKASRNVKEMAEARAQMIMRVDSGQLVHMLDRDPMVVWERLAKVHRACPLALRSKLCTAVKAESESMQSYIGRVQAIAFQLESIGDPVSDQDKMMTLLVGLDKSYDPLVRLLHGTRAESSDVDYVISWLLAEEARRESEAMSAKSSVAMERAVKDNKSKNARKCWQCGKEGHVRAFCREKRDWLQNETDKPDEEIFFTGVAIVDSQDHGDVYAF
jgi:hypothetical protein